MMIRSLLAASLLFLAVGCAHSDNFEVMVVNRTAVPLSVGLVKNGPPLEKGWDAPEQIALGAPNLMDKHWGILVPPHDAVLVGPQSGSFDRDARPFLRVYTGDKSIEALMAVSRSSGNRLTVPINPGKSKVTIQLESAGLTAAVSTP